MNEKRAERTLNNLLSYLDQGYVLVGVDGPGSWKSQKLTAAGFEVVDIYTTLMRNELEE